MRSQNKPHIINIILLAAFLGILIALTVRLGPSVTNLVRNPDQFRIYIDSFGNWSILVFILFQILQVIVAAIPGEFVQIAGGYVFGTFLGTVYSVVGILIGAAGAFFIARLLGLKVVNSLFSEKSVTKFQFLMNNRKAEVIIFLLFLIPGLPKDVLVYIAGLSPIKPLRFFSIYTVARMPGLLGSSFIGSNLQKENYLIAIIVFVIACVLFLAGLFMKDMILDKLKGSRQE